MNTSDFESFLENTISEDLNSKGKNTLSSERVFHQISRREDDNIFFSLVALDVLKESHLVKLKERIKSGAESNLFRFKNKFGRCTYNFWPTSPYTQWPRSFIKSRIKHFWIPDDLDCTALSYKFHSRMEFIELRDHIQEFTNINLGSSCKNELTYYSTWFGDKMKPEFDICASCNYLIVLKEKEISPNEIDQSVLVKIKSIFKNLGNQDSFTLSPNYQKECIVTWHLSRLLKVYPEELKKEKQEFLSFVRDKIEISDTNEDKLWLVFSLIELGEETQTKFNQKSLLKFINGAKYFMAPMMYSWTFLPVRLRKAKGFNIEFYSRSFNCLLLLHYQIKPE